MSQKDAANQNSKPPPPPSWSSIPNKFQLAVVCSVRIVDFFQQAALQAYMFYQLQSFNPTADDSEIAYQAGVLQGVFTAAQVITSILWGRVADSPSWGRKGMLLWCLVGQGLSCVGVGFSRTFQTAIIWRCLGGAVNATVGGARTVLSESTEKKYHSRTFLLLPLAWNIANIFGPLVGGLMSNPVESYPGLFGKDSTFGGENGVLWLEKFPYAAPNVFCAIVMFADALLVWVGMKETLITRKHRRDRGIELGQRIAYRLNRTLFKWSGYSQLEQDDSFGARATDDENIRTSTPLTSMEPKESDDDRNPAPRLVSSPMPSFHHAITKNVVLVLAAVAAMDFQMGGFASLFTIFLSSARRTENDVVQLPFLFNGGLGFSLPTIGIAMSILGFVGIIAQLTLFPKVNARFGLLKSTRWSLFVFPMAYALAPYLSLLVDFPFILWTGLILVVILQISARTFAVPGLVLLTNNASPGPALLGTIHGMGAAVSSLFRTIGPIVAGNWYGQGLNIGIVGWAWWWLSFVSLLGVIPCFWARDGK